MWKDEKMSIITDLEDEINRKCDPFIMAHILCFSNWKDPEGFYKLTSKQRHVLMLQSRKYAEKPTTSNYWIWFGAYTGKEKTARLNKDSIPRLLYSQLISPLEGGNLRAVFTSTRSDVNPHKYFPKRGLKRSQVMEEYQRLTGLSNGHDLLTERDKGRFEVEVAECLKKMSEFFTPNILDTREDMKKLMLEHFPSIVIARALEESKLPFIA
jgi:hypothetical protein